MKKKLYSLAAAISSIAMALGSAAPVAAVTKDGNSSYYIDIRNDYYGWTAEAVDCLTEKGVVNGVGDNMYMPAEQIKRCDYAVLLNFAFKLPAINTVAYGFYDVPEDEYYYTAVINAKGNGIVTDVANFYPEDYITRLDAFLMLYRAMQKFDYVKGYGTTDTSMYADESDLVNTESKIAVGTLTNMGILSGRDGYIKPLDTMTRAEMAVLVYSTLSFMDEQDANAALKAENDKNNKNNANDNTDNTDDSSDDGQNAAVGEYDSQKFDRPISFDRDMDINDIFIRASLSKEKMNLDSDGIPVEYTNSPALSSSGSAKLNILNSSVTAYSLPAAVKTYGNSAISFANTTLSGVDSIAVDVSKGNSVSVDGGAVSVKGNKIVAANADGGSLKFTDTTVTSDGFVAVKLLKNADLTAADTKIKANTKDEGAIDIYAPFYESENGTAKINLKNVEIVNSTGAAFFVQNNDAIINLNGGCTIDANDILYTTNASKKSGSTETNVTLNLNNQDLAGKFYTDTTTRVQINVNSGSKFEGSINETQASDRCDFYLAKDGTLVLTDDCYLNEFVTEDEELTFTNIIDNGYIIYYDKNADANNYLDSEVYDLQYGGEIRPRWE